MLDTRELGRRPGSMRKVCPTVPAPADLGVDVIGVPEGAELDLDLRLESVMEGVLVSGTVRGEVTGECVRCLEPIASRSTVDLQELFAYAGQRARTTTTRPSCASSRATCSTSSRRCGTRWCSHCRSTRCAGRTARVCAPSAGRGSRTTQDHGHDAVDPRWAALQALAQDTNEHNRGEIAVAVPKRKMSRSNTRSRRAQWKATAAALVACDRCREQKLQHRLPQLRHLQQPRRSRRLSRL